MKALRGRFLLQLFVRQPGCVCLLGCKQASEGSGLFVHIGLGPALPSRGHISVRFAIGKQQHSSAASS